jgi:hypothetical protein
MRQRYLLLFPRLLAIVVSLAILGWGGLRANSAWHFLAARSITTNMLESADISQTGIHDATTHIKLALNRFPHNPDYLDLRGQLLELQASQPGVVGKEHRSYLEFAAERYRRALSVRPLWPQSWARLLGVKDRLGEVDDEFRLALARSVATGPWEPDVQLQVLNSGLRHWDKLGAKQRSLVRGKIKDALKVQPRDVFEIIRAFGRVDLICGEGVDYPQIKQWCEGAQSPA